MSNLITADQFETETPNNTATPITSSNRLITADEFEREYVTQERPKVSDVVGAPMRFALGVQEGIEQYQKVPSQLMVYMGNAIRQGSARAKMNKNRPEGLYNQPKDMQFTVGQRLLNLGMANLREIQKRQAVSAVARDEKFDFARDIGAGAPSIIQSVLIGATTGPLVAGAAVGAQMLGQKTEQLVGDKESLKQPFMGFGDKGADKLVSQPLMNALVESGLEAATLTKFLGATGPFLQRTIKQTITEGIQEFSQTAGEAAVDVAFQTRKPEELPDALVESVYSFALGAALGGPTAMGFNIMNRNATISHFEEMTGDKKKAIKLADIALEGALDDVTTILETESAMKQAHGEVYDKMYASVYSAIEKSGAMAGMSDDQKASVVKANAKSFADTLVMEATKRGVSASEILNSSDISVNENGGIVFNMPTGEGSQRLEQGGRPQDFATAEEYVASKSMSRAQKRSAIKEWKKNSGYKELDSSFKRGADDESIHAPSSPDSGSPLYDLTSNGTYPEDVYSFNGLKYYGTGEDALDREAYSIIKNVEGLPDKQIRIYRAVEKDGSNKIVPGDWVTTVRKYAKEHGEGNINGGYKIISKVVTAKDIYTSGDSWLEFGYHPQQRIPSEVYRVSRLGLTAEWQAAQSQSLQQGERASITKTGNQYVLEFLKTADPSSIPHELAHFWLDNMFQFVKSGKASTAYNKRWKNISDFLTITPGQDSLTVEQQEKWARSYEAYLYQGATPSPNLVNEYNAYRQWLRSVYKDKTDLGIDLSPQAEAIFDSMVTIDKAYIENRQKFGTRKRKNKFGRDIKTVVDELFVPLSTRLSKVDESLKIALRKYMFSSSIKAKNDIDAVKPFIDKMSKLSPDDYKDFDLALKNRDMALVDEIVKRNEFQAEFAQMQQTLEGIFTRAKDAGLDIGYIEDYFPRRVQDVEDYLDFLRGGKNWTTISREIRNVERESGRPLTEEERAEVADKVIRGYGDEKINTGKASNMKERKISALSADQNIFYKSSQVALLEYIQGMNDKIETAKFIGHGGKNLDESVGAYVDDLVKTGVINATNEKEVRDVLKSIIGKRGTKGFWTSYKNFSYIYTMGSPLSAITQIGDLAFSLYKNGFFGTVKAITQGEKVSKQDIGIDMIAEEFSDQSKSGKAVNAVFNAVGLSWMDGLGKATILTGALNRLSKDADNIDLDAVFGENANQVRADLKAKNLTDDVKFLLFSELADVQPIALSEMPEAYVSGGNSRLWYMLKSYTIKQLDVYHNEVFRQIRKDPVKGFRNLLRLTFSLMLMGMSADALKDVLLGRPITLSDLVVDNIIKAIGFSKYTIYKAKREGALTAAMQIMNPPIPFIDDLIKDVTGRFKDEPPEVKDMKIWNALPVVGKFYYWWFGGGRTYIEKDE